MSSTFGVVFRVTSFGESHGAAIGGVVDGCPAGLAVSEAAVQAQLDRRRPGQNALTTQRREADRVRILSGVQDGTTLGTPIGLLIENTDRKPGDYASLQAAPRPSHADLTYRLKYGVAAASGGGRASARETAVRVAAGAIAESFLATLGVEVIAWVSAIGGEEQAPDAPFPATRAEVDAHLVRCPDAALAGRMQARIEAARAARDSVGGVVTCVCRGLPGGWGEPVFDKLEAVLAHAMLSLPATKGFEIGSGFAGTRLTGSAHNDLFMAREGGKLGTVTNRSGGVQGGITNGEPIVFRVAFKPTATIAQPQASVDYAGRPVVVEGKGRHDPCVLPRAVPIVEAMAALVLADAALRQRAR